MDYAYSPVADEDLALEAETLCYVKEQPWRYRELLSASIRDVETDEKLDLVEELPSGWKVYLDLVDEPAAWCLYRDKAITLAPRFANEFCYHSLAHEVGHAWGSIHNPHLYQNGGSKVEQYARDIACERNAHEYALLKLKPFLSSDNDDPFNDTSFRGNSMLALQTYTDGICDKIEYEQSRRERVLKSVKIGGFAIAGLVFTARSIARR